MLGHLIRWELARYLRSYRLLVLFVGGPVLIVAATLIHLSEVREQRSAWSRLSAEAEATANLERVVVPRPAPSLGFLRGATREQRGEAAVVSPHLVDNLEKDVSERSFLFAAEPLDWTAVIVFFYSLMAVALSFDAVAGEKAGGTLRVVASRPVGRIPLILSKILACFLVVSASLLLGAVAGLAVAVIGGGLSPNGSHGLVLVLALVHVLLFLLFNVLLGMAASVSTPIPETALRRALGAWTLLALVVPGFVVVLASVLRPVESEMAFQRNAALHEQGYRGRLSVSSMPLTEIVRTPGISASEKRRRIRDLEAEMQAEQEAALREMERGYADLRRQNLLQGAAQEEWIDRWGALSPHTLLRGAMSRLAVAGSAGRSEFQRQLSRFEPVFTSFVLNQRELRRDEAFESGAKAMDTDDDGEEYVLQALNRLDYSEVLVPANELPRFTWRSPSAAELAAQTLPGQLWMLLFITLTGAFTFLRFQSYDCR